LPASIQQAAHATVAEEKEPDERAGANNLGIEVRLRFCRSTG